MVNKENATYCDVLFSFPQVSNIFNLSNSSNRNNNPSILILDIVNINLAFVIPQVYDLIAQTLSLISPVNLAILVKLDDDNYLIWCK